MMSGRPGRAFSSRLLLALAVTVSTPAPAAGPAGARTTLVAFATAPFPYRGPVPPEGKPFLDVEEGGRRGHASARGGVYWEDRTYSDRRVLLHIPSGFDPTRPAVMVVYLHGNLVRLERDVRDRQQVPRQVAQSGLNAVLVAPQLAVNALDSSAGRFWEPGLFARFVDEAGDRLADLFGDARARPHFGSLPVVLVAYSGGYQPAAYALDVGGTDDRIRGVVLLDALYAEEDKFAAWIGRRRDAFFFSAYSRSSDDGNTMLGRLLTERGVAFQTRLPSRLTPGSVTLFSAGDDLVHNDFVSSAWIEDPLKAVLARIPGYSRGAPRRQH
jgi:hypothetical protein